MTTGTHRVLLSAAGERLAAGGVLDMTAVSGGGGAAGGRPVSGGGREAGRRGGGPAERGGLVVVPTGEAARLALELREEVEEEGVDGEGEEGEGGEARDDLEAETDLQV